MLVLVGGQSLDGGQRGPGRSVDVGKVGRFAAIVVVVTHSVGRDIAGSVAVVQRIAGRVVVHQVVVHDVHGIAAGGVVDIHGIGGGRTLRVD